MKTVDPTSGGLGYGPQRRLGQRLRAVSVATLAATTLIIGLNATPASAQPIDCANALHAFQIAMNQARFWIGAADRLAAAGDDAGAQRASAEANYYMDQAADALGGC